MCGNESMPFIRYTSVTTYPLGNTQKCTNVQTIQLKCDENNNLSIYNIKRKLVCQSAYHQNKSAKKWKFCADTKITEQNNNICILYCLPLSKNHHHAQVNIQDAQGTVTTPNQRGKDKAEPDKGKQFYSQPHKIKVESREATGWPSNKNK